jgi:hypothetical protein
MTAPVPVLVIAESQGWRTASLLAGLGGTTALPGM